MKKKKFILLAIVLISLLQLTMLVMLASWNTVIKPEQVMYNFLLNLPNWLFIGGVDFLLIYFLEKKVKWKNDILRIVTDLLVCNFVVLLFTVVLNYFVFNAEIPPYLIQFAIPIVIWNSMIIFVFEIFIYNRKQIEVEKKLVSAEREKIQYQYETLKAQINPHFLFNSLNVLSSLAYHDADKANKFTKKLSSVYRYLLLTNSRPEVSLREELAFLDSYLYLEKIRFENTFCIEIVIDDDSLLTNKVIPVTLQLLVENILKHNISTREKPLHAQIHITDNGICVKNSLQLRSSVDKGGIGLLNLQKQYELHDDKICITQTDSEFIVLVPYIK